MLLVPFSAHVLKSYHHGLCAKSDPRTIKIGVAESCPGEICPGEICLGEICPHEICPGEICLGEICPGEICPHEICPGEICPGEICPHEICPGEICLGEICPLSPIHSLSPQAVLCKHLLKISAFDTHPTPPCRTHPAAPTHSVGEFAPIFPRSLRKGWGAAGGHTLPA
jgi:hypothetical protein